ncbi:MAG TPA: SURF1 family protein [Rhodocyclaceae bacterium]|nr:SURF1 family protein [Rhodocyclaceae bacterium]
MKTTARSSNGVRRLCAGLLAATSGRRFRPSLAGGVVALAVATLCVQLGHWQAGKADQKQAAQARLDRLGHDAAVDITAAPVDAEVLHGRPVRLRGRFETEYQFFVDNRVHREQAGYHVITPLRLEGSDRRILVNRGWIPALARHSDVPQVDTPTGPVTLVGVAMVPGHRFFTLGTEAASAGWPAVWQNLDLERFARLAGVPVQPVIVQLDPSAPAGFAREWPRADERYERHLSYAYQWYGFGGAAGLIWFALAWRRR